MRAIEYRRGQLHILHREALEAVVCECYSTMRAEFRKNEAEFIQVHSLSEK
jgi:hypothetical protein